MAFCEQCGAQILSKNPSPRSFSCIIRMPDGFYNHLAYFFCFFFALAAEDCRFLPAPLRVLRSIQ